jgi:DNA-binding MarR family transcriptional regulator
MDVHQTTASNLVKSLVHTNMVQAQKNGKDKRTVQLFVLPDGQRVLLSAPGPFSGVLPHALSRLDEATLERLETDLSTLLKLLDSDKAAEKIPLAQM